MSPETGVLPLLALGCAIVWARAFRTRNALEFRARLCEVLAFGVRQQRPLLPVVEAAAKEFVGLRRRALDRVQASLASGASLPDALRAAGRRFFPDDVVASVRSADGTAALGGALRAAGIDGERRLDVRHRALLALIYPFLLIGFYVALYSVGGHFRDIFDSVQVGPGALFRLSLRMEPFLLWGALVGIVAWLCVGRPHPGRALFAWERRLRVTAARLRSGTDWDTARENWPQRPPLPADLQVRVDASLRKSNAAAADTAEELANECSRRATRGAERSLRLVQVVLLGVVALLAAIHLHAVFAVTNAIRLEIMPW
ncbi:MAG: type II secretion system F family protein [Planctomycetota bacterium]